MTIGEFSSLVLIGLGALALLAVLLGAVWLVVAGTEYEDDWPDHDPTLDVQNHHGDARPIR